MQKRQAGPREGLDPARIFINHPDGRREPIYGHTDLALIEGGNTPVSIGGERQIKLWNSKTLEQRLAIQESEIFHCLAVSPDERIIAAGTREGSIFLYEAPGKPVKQH